MNYKTPTKAIITDAGFASRYLPITKTIPKAMLPLGNRPIMQLVVEECVEAGIKDIIIVATPEGKAIYEDYFHNPVEKIEAQLHKQGKDDRFEPVKKAINLANITVIEQDQSLPYGNGSPVASAKHFINDDEAFIVAYSDDVVFGKSAVKDLIDAQKEHPEAAAIIAGQPVEHEEIKKYASISLDGDKLVGLVEKPDPADAPSDLASYGRYLLTPEVFQHLDPKNIGLDGELWTADAIAKLIPTDRVYVKKTSGTWMTTGDPKNYFLSHLRYVKDYEDYYEDIKKFVSDN
ncbi:NTP transferase domain-containing protein [Candidatus Saccharibacteria bacterium]|nr:NTP transferase domain-containing protein [Candidatus Saccharibacteria bacterium]